MDTRSKSRLHSNWFKALLFVLIIVFFTITVVKTMYMLDKAYELGIIFEDTYFQSERFNNDMYNNYNDIHDLIFVYKNEKHILEGNLLSESEIEWRLNDRLGLDSEDVGIESTIDVEEEKDKIISEMIEEDLEEFKIIKSRLENNKDIVYYGSNGKDEYSNLKKDKLEDINKYQAYIVRTFEKLEFHPKLEDVGNYRNNFYFQNIYNSNKGEISKDGILKLAFKDNYIAKERENWENERSIYRKNTLEILIYFTLTILTFIFYIVLLGRDYFGDEELKINFIDRIYTDINIFICVLLIIFWFSLAVDNMAYKTFVIIITGTIGSLGLILVSSLIKNIKNKTLIKNSLIYIIVKEFLKAFKNIYTSTSLGKKMVGIILLFALSIRYSRILFPVIIFFFIRRILKETKRFEEIKTGVKKIRNGNIEHKIDIANTGELGELAEDLNEIAEGLNKAIDNELKSERMKTELITNVSHDIRTPLTSIITYVDLLKREKDPEKREEYIEIIDKKAERLKLLIDDLFEASKLSSGNIPVEFEKINLVSLINQGLGEVSDKIEENNLEFIVDYRDRKEIYVLADGNLLWRGLENLLSNIFKYALENSRVYIDVETKGENVYITMKNISAYQLNITEEELLERFQRGDESRTSEGSGLGLSITRDLIEVQNGEFNIEIDGDLFKTIIILNKYEEE